jgi:hypothetical protein
MTKVLILAYDFPPYVSVGGLRPYSWYKYFNEFDIYPIVVTRQWSAKHNNQLEYISASDSNKTIIEENKTGKILRTPYQPNLANRLLLKYGETRFAGLRRIISAYFELLQYIIPIGPKSQLYFAAKNYLNENKVDVIIATGDPFVLFKYASELGKKHNIPWIADYRDVWSQNRQTQNNFVLKKWSTFFEKKIISTATAIITVSDFLEKKISPLSKDKPFYILPNGFDPDNIEITKNITQQNNILNIAFMGSIYDFDPLRSFLAVFSELVNTEKSINIKLNFYGVNLHGVTFNGSLDEIISNDFPELINYVHVHRKMSNQLLLKELAQQNVMLLFNYYSSMGTKIYDYIGLNRVILFCYSNDKETNLLKEKYYQLEEIDGISKKLQEELIIETNSGYVVKDANHLKETLRLLYNEFTAKGFIKCNTINAEKYSRKHQVKELANIIKKISI